jgi:hypothetical protein
MADFNFDRRALEHVADDALRRRVAEMQRALDSVHRTHAGKPVAEIEPALRSACRRADMTPDGAQLRQWAEAIRAGTRIILKPERVRL